MKIHADDGTEFATAKECRAYERSLKPAGRVARVLSALPEGLAAEALAAVDGELAKQLVTLGSQINRARREAGLTKTRKPNNG